MAQANSMQGHKRSPLGLNQSMTLPEWNVGFVTKPAKFRSTVDQLLDRTQDSHIPPRVAVEPHPGREVAGSVTLRTPLAERHDPSTTPPTASRSVIRFRGFTPAGPSDTPRTPRRLGLLGTPQRLNTPAPGPFSGLAARLEAAAPMPAVQHGRFEPFTLQTPRALSPPRRTAASGLSGAAQLALPSDAASHEHTGTMIHSQHPFAARVSGPLRTPGRLAASCLAPWSTTVSAQQSQSSALGLHHQATSAVARPPLTPATARRPAHRAFGQVPLPAFGSPVGVLSQHTPAHSRAEAVMSKDSSGARDIPAMPLTARRVVWADQAAEHATERAETADGGSPPAGSASSREDLTAPPESPLHAGSWSPSDHVSPTPPRSIRGGPISAPAGVEPSEEEVQRRGPRSMSPEATRYFPAASCSEVTPGHTAVSRPLQGMMPQRTPGPKAPGARELRRLQEGPGAVMGGDLGTVTHLSPVRASRTSTTQVATPVRRSTRTRADGPDVGEVLRAAHFRFVPPGRHMSPAALDSPAQDAASAAPVQHTTPAAAAPAGECTPAVGVVQNAGDENPAAASPAVDAQTPEAAKAASSSSEFASPATPAAPARRVTRAASAKKVAQSAQKRRVEAARHSPSPSLSPTEERIRSDLRRSARHSARKARAVCP